MSTSKRIPARNVKLKRIYEPASVEDGARGIAKDTVATYQDIVPTVPNKADVNDVVKKAVESAIFGGVSAQEALDKAVADANKLLK